MSAELASNSRSERLLDLLEGGEPGRAALVTAETGSDAHLRRAGGQAVASLAGRLATLGVGRGSRVALVLPDGPDFLQLLLAVTSLGATAAPLNPAYKRDEYAFYLDDLKPELLLVPAGELEAAREAGAGRRPRSSTSRSAGGATRRCTAGGSGRADGALEPAEPDDVALLLHTSGTTSRPEAGAAARSAT